MREEDASYVIISGEDSVVSSCGVLYVLILTHLLYISEHGVTLLLILMVYKRPCLMQELRFYIFN